MMRPQNVLFGHLPEAVTVSGREYPVNTDFRTWLEAGEILKSDMITERKIPMLINLCYKDSYPQNSGLALSGIMAFYKNAFPGYRSTGRSDFSADFDGKLIYSGFYKAYGIDLSTDAIHWYRFAPLFYELSDCAFSKVLGYRSADIGKLPQTHQKHFAALKSAVSIPSHDSDKSFAEALFEIF